MHMTEIVIKKNIKKRRPKRDKLKRWNVVFVEDSDNEREEINNKVKRQVEIIHIETGLLQQTSMLM
jgi:hypothetical protein